MCCPKATYPRTNAHFFSGIGMVRWLEFGGENVGSIAKVVAKGGTRVRICKGGLSGVLWKKADEKE